MTYWQYGEQYLAKDRYKVKIPRITKHLFLLPFKITHLIHRLS